MSREYLYMDKGTIYAEILLFWRVFYASVGTKDITIFWSWFKYCFTVGAFVKILASVNRHSSFLLQSTFGASGY